MDGIEDYDYISDLPQGVLENILVRLPIRDAVMTSLLSSKWRYRWATMRHLVFDDQCIGRCSNQRLVDFVTRALFLHQGPIHKFHISTGHLQSLADFDQWILFLSRSEVRELILELGEEEWFKMPSCLFNCRKLTRLELYRCEFDPPANFAGFPCLKNLGLHQVLVAPEAVETLISSCPLLENLSLSYFDNLAVRIRAPNLKYLYLEGEFMDIILENTPLLVGLSVSMYITDETTEHLERSSNCNFINFLGGVPNLERLVGLIYFTKYLSLGDYPRQLPIKYESLKMIELSQVSFEDTQEIGVVLCLISNSPNLVELHLSGSSNNSSFGETPDLDFWDEECPKNCSFERLKVVTLTEMSGVPHEMEFIKFVLAHSSVLETITITPCSFVVKGKINMLVQLVKFRRASFRAEVIFIQD